MAKVEPKIVRGLAQIGISKITVGADDRYTYAPIERFFGSREFSAEPQGELYELYADSNIYYAEETNNGYIGKLTMVRLADKFKKEIMGLTEDPNDKMLYEKSNKVDTPKFGLVVYNLTNITKGIYYIFYDCQVSKRPTISTQTQEKSINPQMEEVEILISPRSYDDLVMSTNTAETPDDVFNKLSTEIWEPNKGGVNP